jgi:hypothetical protein
MTPLPLSRVVQIALAHAANHDHATALTQVVGIETVTPTVWVVKTKTFRHTMANTGWLLIHLPDALAETHPGGECISGFYCIDFVTENGAFTGAKKLAEGVA